MGRPIVWPMRLWAHDSPPLQRWLVPNLVPLEILHPGPAGSPMSLEKRACMSIESTLAPGSCGNEELDDVA
jgi:hypothetical protein